MGESSYRERPARLPGAVLWVSEAAGAGEILPDGCMDLIWVDGALLLAGPDEVPFHAAASPHRHVGLRLPPGLLPQLLGRPAADLLNQRVALDDLELARPVRRAVADCAVDDPEEWLERLALRLRADLAADRVGVADRATAARRWLGQGHSVADTAARLALDVRQLRRLSHGWFGYGPKTLARILRLQRALATADRAKTGADVAALTGYADQSHLNRDARKIAGRPFSALAADH